MFWADKLLENVSGKQLINDAWTPSGIIHMGGLKGPVIHDTLFKILKARGHDVKFQFGFDDMDAIDGLSKELLETHGKYMGIPICNAPSPDGEGSFGDYYGRIMRRLFKELNIEANIYLASDYYKKGIYNKAIQFVLDNADKIRKVYAEIYKKEIDKSWFPLQVVCPNCGKVGTTEVTAWDGKEVSYACRKDKVKWAQGCEKSGKISPFDGNSTMPFKVEWAAKWWTFGVTIEGAGKDHASAGGTYDVARKILKDVFEVDPPLFIPYEFFLYDGKKMSSSKGLGLTGEKLLEVLSPQIARFLMIKTSPNQAIEFNINGTLIIPKLFDDYEKAREEFNEGVGTDLARAFELSQISELPPKVWDIPRFSEIVNYVQMPNINISGKFMADRDWRGAGNADDRRAIEYSNNLIDEMIRLAKVWLDKYAPEDEKFTVREKLPEEAKNLSSEQKKYLSALSGRLDTKDAESLQTEIYELSKQLEIPSKDAFAAIYLSLLGKDHGPKAAWLILSLDKEFVKKRFEEASK